MRKASEASFWTFPGRWTGLWSNATRKDQIVLINKSSERDQSLPLIRFCSRTSHNTEHTSYSLFVSTGSEAVTLYDIIHKEDVCKLLSFRPLNTRIKGIPLAVPRPSTPLLLSDTHNKVFPKIHMGLSLQMPKKAILPHREKLRPDLSPVVIRLRPWTMPCVWADIAHSCYETTLRQF